MNIEERVDKEITLIEQDDSLTNEQKRIEIREIIREAQQIIREKERKRVEE